MGFGDTQKKKLFFSWILFFKNFLKKTKTKMHDVQGGGQRAAPNPPPSTSCVFFFFFFWEIDLSIFFSSNSYSST